MPINVTVTAESAKELTKLIHDLAGEFGIHKDTGCHCSNNVTVETYSTAPDLSNLPDAQMNETPATDGPHPGTPVDETEETDTAFEQDEDESLNSDDEDEDSDDDSDDEDEVEDELTGCNDAPNDEISSHFDEIFGTVGNRPMCGDRVTINGSLFQGGGKVVNTNYSLLYDAAYDYDTKIIRVKADNGKKYSYNKSDLRAKKVTKA